MPSSQDVLPSASMLTWIGGKKIGCQDLLIALPTLLPLAVCAGWPLAHCPVQDPCSFSYRAAKGASGLETRTACRVLLL